MTEDTEIVEQADGSAIVALPETPEADESSHGENLAEKLSYHDLNSLATDLLELIEKDQEARKKRDEQQEEGIKRTGLGGEAPGGATFDGATRAVHPALAEGCVDFSARAIKELFPAKGPVKTKINGKIDDRRVLDKAKRKRDYLNWQLTTQIKEYRDEKEILLTQLPLGGSQYEKFWYDPTLKRVRMEFVPIDEVFLPYAAQSFYTSPRITHVQTLTKHTFEDRIRSGFYRDIDNLVTESDPEQTASSKATDKIEGREKTGYNEDGTRVVYETQCWRQLEDEEAPKPYIIHLDFATDQVLAIYRNWAEDDPTFEKLDWWVEDKFIPWRGAYGIGLLHLIGSLAASATGALRALLDSAHINTVATAIKLKGGRTSGQNVSMDVASVTEIEAPAGTDDIRKVIMAMPFNPPSAVLFQLLEWITNQAKGVVATAEERIADAGNNMPVGTTLALIEQGSQVFSAIHGRLHASQAKALKIICRLNHDYPDEKALAKYELTAEDFSEYDDVEPVSDPNIFSEAQRYAQLQEEIKLVATFPELAWDKFALAKRALELLRAEHSDEILPKKPEPVTADPVSENVAVMSNAPLKAVKTQDHAAHIQTHLAFIINPLNMAIPGPMPQLGALMAHVQEHLTMEYEMLCMQALPQARQLMTQAGQEESPDALASMANNVAAQSLQQMSQTVGPLLQQAGQVLSAKMPQPPIDPAIQKTFEASMAEIKRKADESAARLDFDKQKAGGEAQAAQQQQQIDAKMSAMENMIKAQMAQASEAAAARIAELQQHVEMMKNDADNRQHQETEIIKNLQDNQTALQIALEKAQATPPAAATAPEAPDFSPQIEALNKALEQVEKSRSQDSLAAVMQGLQATIQTLSAPKMIIHDAAGKPIGIGSANQ